MTSTTPRKPPPLRLGNIYEYAWETLDRGTIRVVGVLVSADGSGVCIDLANPTPFSAGAAPREGLYVRGDQMSRLRLIDEASNGAEDVGGACGFGYLSHAAGERRMERAKALLADLGLAA